MRCVVRDAFDKLTVQLLRTLTKPISNDEMRPVVRAELLDANKSLSAKTSFQYKDALPKALDDRVREIVSADRQRN